MNITERVEELAAVMRRVGAVRAEINKTGIKLELGVDPGLPTPDAIPKTDDQIIHDAKLEQKRIDRLQFAATEGFLDDGDE